MSAPGLGFGIYIHWPFCRLKCPYCDFNSHVRERIDHARWRSALLRELEHYARDTQGRTVTSIFFGGGTPSLMEPETVAALIARARDLWRIAGDIEITLEANPTSAEIEKFRAFREGSVNRVSLGVQSLIARDLKFLGRQHDAAQALAAVQMAATTFDRFSFDLIYARPGQTLEQWQDELDRALEFAAGHISLYQLTIEPGTQFEQAVARGDFRVLDEEHAAELYEATVARLGASGLADYEISNFARPGEESRHNLTYWRYGDYVGVGPGAHGRLTINGEKFATRQHRAPEAWLDLVERDGHATRQRDLVPRPERLNEMLMMGLRLKEGVPMTRIEEESAKPFAEALDPARLQRLIEGGFLTLSGDRLAATAEGRQRLDAVLAALVA
ncbi:radical SAM family heme chaperone HemW [Dongia deserti]|uniref:radical SAM family heme chaperone HemW n=1 Tax=Dongia deserti TaxID=2268030 RepID=UPI000E65A9A2|nr:radical SAM family heme chaperone HemW [Dongia deserti]